MLFYFFFETWADSLNGAGFGRGQLYYLPLITSGEPLLEIDSYVQQCVESLHGPPLEFSEAGRRLAEEKPET